MDAVEFQESNSITFEWTLRGLKNLFESRCVLACLVLKLNAGNLTPCLSKGDAKSKVTKSTKFGGGRWQVSCLAALLSTRIRILILQLYQVLFYANSGPPYPSTDVSGASSGGYVSLFLSCEVRSSYFLCEMRSSGRRSACAGGEGCCI